MEAADGGDRAWAERSRTLLFCATVSGGVAEDRDAHGGNPFASALIEVLDQPPATLAELPDALRRKTLANSRRGQTADVPSVTPEESWALVPRAAGETRIALVLVVSDYSRAHGISSLRGARHDAGRIAAALGRAGFVTEQALDLDAVAMRARLAEFARMSASYEAAAIYTTGHGLETDGRVYLLPGDYPAHEHGAATVAAHGVSLETVVASARSRCVNLIFYGGCRNQPLG